MLGFLMRKGFEYDDVKKKLGHIMEASIDD